MRFETKRDHTFLIIYLFLLIVYCGISAYSIIFENDYSEIWFFISILIVFGLFFILIYKTTYFVLESDQLVCKFLFFKKSIAYKNIRKIEMQKGLYAGFKMSTAWKGLVLYYNKFDELLISPEREDEFIKELETRILK